MIERRKKEIEGERGGREEVRKRRLRKARTDRQTERLTETDRRESKPENDKGKLTQVWKKRR